MITYTILLHVLLFITLRAFYISHKRGRLKYKKELYQSAEAIVRRRFVNEGVII